MNFYYFRREKWLLSFLVTVGFPCDFWVTLMRNIIKGDLRRGLEHMSVHEHAFVSACEWSVWEAYSWSLGVRGSQASVYHFMIGDSEIGRQSGMEPAVLDCEFINQTEFRDCKFLNFPWVWNRKIHWMLVFQGKISMSNLYEFLCIFPLCMLS